MTRTHKDISHVPQVIRVRMSEFLIVDKDFMPLG